MCAVSDEVKCRFCGGVGASCAPYTAIVEVPYPSAEIRAQKPTIGRYYVCARCYGGDAFKHYYK